MSKHVRLIQVYDGKGITEVENALEEGFVLADVTAASNSKSVYYLLIKSEEN